MNLVRLDGVRKQYSDRLLLDDVDLLINRGDRIGLIGVNGSGKTTLLRIVAGLEAPDTGQVTVWGGVRLRYVPQAPDLDETVAVLDQIYASDAPLMRLLRRYEAANRRLQAAPADPARQAALSAVADEMTQQGGWTAEAQAKTVLTRLGVTAFDAPVATLSGGQRKRVALARAFIDPADLLILDEPTNHIDADAVEWLESALRDYDGAVLMVTHDRYFLARVVNRIVDLDRRRLVNYSGGYERYLAESTARQAQLAAAEARHQRLLQRELAWLRRGVMARSTKQKARRQRLEALRTIRYDRGENISLSLAARRLGKKVLTVRGLHKAYGDQVLFSALDFELGRGERIGVVGPNGSGKSTFLDILAGRTPPDAGQVDWGETVRLGYYDQESRDLDPSLKVIDLIQREAPLIRSDDGRRIEAPQMLEWFLFSRAEQQARVGSLSGGEQRRLYLLRTLIHQPNVLFLDEPTNDLDLKTLAVLEQFLDDFQGSLLVVSHDRYFLDRNVDFLMSFEDGVLGTRYPTPYETYRALVRDQSRSAAPVVERPSAAAPRRAAPRRAAPDPGARRLTWAERRELTALEATIAELETTQAAAEAAVNAAGDDYLRLQAMSDELAAVAAQLERALERWVTLSEIAENE